MRFLCTGALLIRVMTWNLSELPPYEQTDKDDVVYAQYTLVSYKKENSIIYGNMNSL